MKMNQLKEDMEEAKERLKSWWDQEPLDRPCISYIYPKEYQKIPDMNDVQEYFDPFRLAEYWDDVSTTLSNFENTSKIFHFGGENIPRFNPYYGPGIMAAVLGITPEFKSRTLWFSRETAVDEIIPLLEDVKINMNNPWYERLIRTTETCAKRAEMGYCIAVQDLGGILDILSSFLGPTKLILTMKRNPEIIDTCRAIILEKLLKVYDDLQKIISQYSAGYSSWMNIWCHKPWYPIQCDFSAFLSPEWFRRFALPDIIEQANYTDYVVYHLDGPDALKHIDDLLDVDSINGIQWVPGAGKELKCSDQWMPVYKKIQAKGKNVVIDFFELPEKLTHFYKTLDPNRLFVTIIFLEYLRAKFFIPEFVGGKGGKGRYREFKKNYRRFK